MKLCVHCSIEITGLERDAPHSKINDGAEDIHRACLVRMIAGSVAHQQGRCRCFGGVDEDAPGLDRREAALAAFDYVRGWRERYEARNT